MSNLTLINRNNFIRVILILTILFAYPKFKCFSQDSVSRIVKPFDNNWRFLLGDYPDAKFGNYNDSFWKIINIPHDYSIEGAYNAPPNGNINTGFFYHGIAWYRKKFMTPSDTLKKTVIEFDGIYMNSEVYINGKFLGARPNGFVVIRYDITDYLNKNGQENIIAVRVNVSEEATLRWYSGAGIYRHARLIQTEFTHFKLDGGIYFTSPQVNSDSATLKVNYTIDANFLNKQDYIKWTLNRGIINHDADNFILSTVVLNAQNKEVAKIDEKISLKNMQQNQKFIQHITVKNPQLWSAESPYLYTVKSILSYGGNIIDDVSNKHGFKNLIFDADKGFLVNNKSVKLKGVCLHQDAGSFGIAVPIEIWMYRFKQLKEMGCNAIRTTHHPFSPEFYDLCDKMGFYVFDEAFDEWTRGWIYNFAENNRGKVPGGYYLYFNQWHETDLRDMLHQNRNHPSIILYSIGNEIPEQFNEDGWKIVKNLVRICHEVDPTRPVTAGCNYANEASKNGFMQELDIFGYNYIDLINGDSTYLPERKRFPNRVLLGSENNHDVHYWLAVRDLNYVIGEFIWTGFDYFGESKGAPLRGSKYGEIDMAGGKKTGYYQRKAYWNDSPTLKIFTSAKIPIEINYKQPSTNFTWNFEYNQTVGVRVATNCDEAELFINNKSLGRKQVSKNLYFSDWTVNFKPGKLKALGFKNGKLVSSAILNSTSIPYKLQLKEIELDNKSAIKISEVYVTDKNGLQINNANNLVKIEVEGDAELIGVDSGEMDYTGNFKTNNRKAFNGRLLVTIRETKQNGTYSIKAKSDNLITAELNSKK